MSERRHVPRTNRPRVLIVDDHADTCDLYEAVLQTQGFDVICAPNGETALAALNAGPFAALVADAEMPGMDGWTLIARLKADSRYAALLVVMVTAHAFPVVAERARQSGCAACFVKPFLPLDLAAALRALLFPTD